MNSLRLPASARTIPAIEDTVRMRLLQGKLKARRDRDASKHCGMLTQRFHAMPMPVWLPGLAISEKLIEIDNL